MKKTTMNNRVAVHNTVNKTLFKGTNFRIDGNMPISQNDIFVQEDPLSLGYLYTFIELFSNNYGNTSVM